MEYIILIDSGPGPLAKMVNARLDLGWEPYGFPFVNGHNYLQAMVKHDPARYMAERAAPVEKLTPRDQRAIEMGGNY